MRLWTVHTGVLCLKEDLTVSSPFPALEPILYPRKYTIFGKCFKSFLLVADQSNSLSSNNNKCPARPNFKWKYI